MDEPLRRELIRRATHDQAVRAELAASGELFDGYAPRMREVHRDNAAFMQEVLAEHGWPGTELAGTDGAEAAWLLIQHAIDFPDLLRRARDLLRAAVDAGDAPAWQFAHLDDRIRIFEGKPQRYGTQFEHDEAGQLSPAPIEEPESVDRRRAEVGLGSLAERTRQIRAQAARDGERPPADRAAWRRDVDAWARSVGWRRD